MATRQRGTSKAEDGPEDSATDDGAATSAASGGSDAPAAKPEPDPSAHRSSGSEASTESGKSSGAVYLNVSGGPLVYSRDAAMVEADGWTPPVNLDELGQRQRRNRFLLPRSEL